MGVLERLWSWLVRPFRDGEDSADEAAGGSSDAAEEAGEDSGSDASDGPDLDPSGVTETRTTGQEDAAEALRETRRERTGADEPDPAAGTGDQDSG